MSAPTYYLAASSASPTKARECMADLEALGLTCLYDWTRLDEPLDRWPTVAADELDAVGNADVFVMLAPPVSPVSQGACSELGARLMSRKPAHVVGYAGFFTHHRLVVRHETWREFLQAVKALGYGPVTT